MSGIVLCAAAETVGSVDTAFKLLGPDHKVVLEVFYGRLIEGSPQNSVTAVPVPANQPIPVQ